MSVFRTTWFRLTTSGFKNPWGDVFLWGRGPAGFRLCRGERFASTSASVPPTMPISTETR